MKVLMVSMDTVRAARLGAFGSTEVQTPNLDRIAAEGAAFGRCFATDIPTQPSHTAVFTGREGLGTGIVSHFHPPANLAEEVAWLPTMLQQAGCRTGAVDHLFSMKEWFIRGYDDYMVPPGRSRSPGSVINDLAFPWLEQHAAGDFYLFLHFWDAHIPYVPPSPWLERHTAGSSTWVDPDLGAKLRSRPSYPLFKRNNYDLVEEQIGPIPNLDYLTDLHLAEIAYLDHEIGRLYAHLEGLGILDEVVWVLFGDHGEVTVEHDAWFDHAGLWDAVTHVPLIVRAPGRMPVAEVDALVALTDVLPTVLDLVDIGTEAPLDGASLVPLAAGEVRGHRQEVFLSEGTWQASRGVRTDRWKLIRPMHPGIYDRTEVELYDVLADPDEQVDVAGGHPEVVADLTGRLDRWLEAGLGGRPDPLEEVVRYGLPAVRRLESVVAEDAVEEAARAAMLPEDPSPVALD